MSAFLEIPVLSQRAIVLHPPLTDDEFERMSAQCDSASLERSREGAIIVNPPAGHSASDANSEINRQLRNWWIQHRRGRTSDSSGGFFSPMGRVSIPTQPTSPASNYRGLHRRIEAAFCGLPRLL